MRDEGDLLHVSLIDENGDIIERVRASQYNQYSESSLYQEERRNFKFKSNGSKIVVAMLLQSSGNKSDVDAIMFLSKAMMVSEMQSLRDEVYYEKENDRVKSAIDSVEMLWGA